MRPFGNLAVPLLLSTIAAAVRLQASFEPKRDQVPAGEGSSAETLEPEALAEPSMEVPAAPSAFIETLKPEVDAAAAKQFTDHFIDPAGSQIGNFVQMLVQRTKSGATDPTFDEAFFRNTCDLSEHTTEGFNTQENKVSSDSATDGARWQRNKKCVNADIGFNNSLMRTGFRGTSHECANLCAEVSGLNAGHSVCCMHDRTGQICAAEIGWQAMKDHGNWWWRKEHLARLIFTSSVTAPYAPADEEAEATATNDDAEIVKNLLTQVNSMSIDGILDHLLSFYICMRWVPDQEFVDLAQFELTQVSLDEKTPAVTDAKATRRDVMLMVLNNSLTPLRCTSQVNVQNIARIDYYLNAFGNSSSDLSRVYTFSKDVHEASNSWFNRVDGMEQAMFYNASRGKDSVFLQDMRAVARSPDVLPWPTFLRSSNYYEHHDSQAKNAFMICFGPRIASFPHKRESGKFVLADQNMAGCNGFWDIATMNMNMDRIKKLFAPELCFEYSLRRELKMQFLRTFVSMNAEFDKAMANQYTKKVHALDPTNGNFDVDSLGIVDPDALGSAYKLQKYQRLAGLVAKSHAKWIVCPTQEGVTGGFGSSDNVFSDPAAYENWIGKLTDDTVPECRTMEDTTGCAKCIIAVKDVHNCHARMNVTLTSLLTAIKDRTSYNHYASSFKWAQHNGLEGTSSGWDVVNRQGTCLVRKGARTSGNAAESGDLQDLRDAFFHLNDTDQIVNLLTLVNPGAGGLIESEFLTTVKTRRDYYHNRALTAPDNDLFRLVTLLDNDRLADSREDWASKFVFTDNVAARDNRDAFKVDYFVSCPCSPEDHAPQAYFDEFGSQGLAEYWNR